MELIYFLGTVESRLEIRGFKPQESIKKIIQINIFSSCDQKYETMEAILFSELDLRRCVLPSYLEEFFTLPRKPRKYGEGRRPVVTRRKNKIFTPGKESFLHILTCWKEYCSFLPTSRKFPRFLQQGKRKRKKVFQGKSCTSIPLQHNVYVSLQETKRENFWECPATREPLRG